MSNRWIALCVSIGLVLMSAVAVFAFDADFDPSTYNPELGEIVNFEVCEPCLGDTDFTYSWDFDGNGVAELETDEPLVTYAFSSAGFHEVVLTISDVGGRTSVARQGVVVGPVPAIATRELLVEADGAIFVLVTITTHATVTLNIEEGIPSGWAVEVVDAGGSMIKINTAEKKIEAAWMSLYDAGETVTLSYRLRPAYTSVLAALSGEVAGYSSGDRFVMDIAGMLALPR